MLSTDPIDVLLDGVTHDIRLDGGDWQWSSGPAGVMQDVKVNTGMIAGEYFYDLDEGIALFKREGIDPNRVIIGSKYAKLRAIAEYTPAVRKSAGIKDITALNITFDPKTREMGLTYSASTEFDDTVADSLKVGG